MSEDVLTPADIAKAMLALRDAPPRKPVYIGPPWAGDHLREHDGGQPGCDRCYKAWSVMVQS